MKVSISTGAHTHEGLTEWKRYAGATEGKEVSAAEWIDRGRALRAGRHAIGTCSDTSDAPVEQRVGPDLVTVLDGVAAGWHAPVQRQIANSDLRARIEPMGEEVENQQVQCYDADQARLLDGDDVSEAAVSLMKTDAIEGDRDSLRRMREQLQVARSACAELARQLQLEKARRARLIAAVSAVQQAKLFQPMDPSPRVTNPPAVDHGDTAVANMPCTPDQTSAMIMSADAATLMSRATDAADTSSAVPARAARTVATLNCDPAQYARQLLDNIDLVYHADVASGLPATALVDRLTANLEYATTAFERRVPLALTGGSSVFQQQYTAELMARGETPFGRHLAVAAYHYEHMRKRANPPREVS